MAKAPKAPMEWNLVRSYEGAEACVRLDGKRVSVVWRKDSEVVEESEEEHRFARQALDAAEARVWTFRNAGFKDRDPAPDEAEQAAEAQGAETQGAAQEPPAELILYRVTAPYGGVTTYLQDGKRVRTDDAIQEFASEEEAARALKQMIHPGKGYVVKKEVVSRRDAGLADLPLTDILAKGMSHFRISELDGKFGVHFQEGADKASTYKKLIDLLTTSRMRTVHLYCDVGASPGPIWVEALGDATLPFQNFIFDTYWDTLTRQQEHSIGDLAQTIECVPKLERLFVSGHVQMSPLTHPRLKELYLLGDPLDGSVLQALSESKLPRLRKLVLCLGQETAPLAADVALESLGRVEAPALLELYLYGVGKPVDTAVKLAAGMPSLASIGVGGMLLEEHLEALTEDELELLSRLDTLELDLDGCELPPPLAESLSNVQDINTDRILPAEYQRW